MLAMRPRVTGVVVVVGLGLLATGCGGGDGGGSSVDISDEDFDDLTAESDVTVDAIDNTFKPQYIEIHAGTAVTFRNDGRNDHNVLPADEGDFAPIDTAEFAPGDEGVVTFDEPGDYAYYCSLHGSTTKGMIGGVRVVE